MTTEPALTPDRFRALADAYGGAIDRWPAATRAAAARLAETDPDARVMLAEADALDVALDRWTVPAPAAALRARVIAAAPAPGRWRRARLWWSGIGIATALAGVAAGSATAAVVAAPADPPAENVTAFGDVGQDG